MSLKVSVRSDVNCPIGTMKADWDAVVQTVCQGMDGIGQGTERIKHAMR